MSWLTSDEMVKVLIDRIGDFENDPEPKADEFLEDIPIHVRQQLKNALIESYTAYRQEMSRG